MTSMNFSVTFNNNVLTIEQKETGPASEIWSKHLDDIKPRSTESLPFIVDKENQFQLFLWQPVNQYILLVYSKKTNIKYALLSFKTACSRLIKIYNNTLDVAIDKNILNIKWYGAIVNYCNIKISDIQLCIGKTLSFPLEIPVFSKSLKDEDMERSDCIQNIQFYINDFIQKGGPINAGFYISMNIQDRQLKFPVKVNMRNNEKIEYQYVPLCSTYFADHAIHLRRNNYGNLVLTCRKMEEIEYTRWFRFWENPFISKILYQLGQRFKNNSSTKISLFYEKFASKAEEGSFDIFQKLREEGKKHIYFIIDKNSPDYDKIKHIPGVIRKYSARYYWLLYRANNYISTEMPFHLNVLRSNNRFFRQTVADNDLIFLQHGVTYLKCHDKNSPLVAGREGAPAYIVVGSEKEKQAVEKYMKVQDNQVLKTGLPIFSKISYKHMTQDSDDIAVIMLTWKPYEESLEDFRESTYYQYTVQIYELLTRLLPPEKVIIVAHPKIESLMEGTPLANSIWKKPISKVLSIAKLLITDYSSVCYNSFYQGGGVVFFQEDLEFYEKANGKLIPADQEYIGKRTYSLEELQQVLQEGIQNQRILLPYFRTPEYEERYLAINEYTDGKNIDRICEELEHLNIIS